MQNISAVLQEIGRHWISGYKPRVNVGEQTKSRMLDVLIEISPQTFEDYLPTADEEEIREEDTRATPQKDSHQACWSSTPANRLSETASSSSAHRRFELLF